MAWIKLDPITRRRFARFRQAYRRPVLLLMGSEGQGLSPRLAGMASRIVRIPMAAGPESLNVAIATALMLYEIRRTDLTWP